MSVGVRPLVAVIPVKHLDLAKSRLAPALDARARRELTVRLLKRTLEIVGAADTVSRVVVVSPDLEVLQVAVASGAVPLLEQTAGHNPALEQARQQIRSTCPTATLLVIAADLPLLTSGDITTLAALTADHSLAIAPDRSGQGTNALCFHPADALPFCFGHESFRNHVAAAERQGLAVHVYRAPGTAFDLDTPADLAELRQFLSVCPHLGPFPLGAD